MFYAVVLISINNKFCGERGIRTPGKELYPYDSLANCWFQPLTHLSKDALKPNIAKSSSVSRGSNPGPTD